MVSCSIVIPTHNREDLLPRAAASALAACPADGEVVVVDDKSAVPAAEVLRSVSDGRLRVVVNTDSSGAARARNLGVASARGDLVFFLDDDDELSVDYCDRVLTALAQAGHRCEWGFSSTIQRRAGVDSLLRRKRLARGPVSRSASPRDQIAALSDGFWIRRSLFLAIGGLDPVQTIDEDTDLCARLLARSHLPWYEPDPGMLVYRQYIPSRSAGRQLTMTTSTPEALSCYRRTHDKNVVGFGAFSLMRWFLATRYMRRAVKVGQSGEARAFARAQRPQAVAFALTAFAYMKQLRHR